MGYTCCYKANLYEKKREKHAKQNKRLHIGSLSKLHASLYLLSLFLYVRFVWVLEGIPQFTTSIILTELVCCEYQEGAPKSERMISFASKEHLNFNSSLFQINAHFNNERYNGTEHVSRHCLFLFLV